MQLCDVFRLLFQFLYKRRGRSFTAARKLEVVEYSDSHGVRVASLQFQVDERTIRRWIQQRVQLADLEPTRRAERGPKARYLDLEAELKEWVLDMRKKKRSVNTVKIRLEAKKLAENREIIGFKASTNWCRKFRESMFHEDRTSEASFLPSDLHVDCKHL